MNHELMVTGYDTGSGQDLNRLRAHLERLEDLARHASPIDRFRLKHSIQLVTVAIEAVDNARQATQRAVQQQRIEETMLAEVIAMVMAKNQETGLLELYLKDTDTSK
jgi:4-hydroxyphenylpyruvate dioxygenase-like putative hemolysin